MKKAFIPFLITLVVAFIGGALLLSGIGSTGNSLSVDNVQAGTRKLNLEIQLNRKD